MRARARPSATARSANGQEARDAERQAREEERNAREEERRARERSGAPVSASGGANRFDVDDEGSGEAPSARATGKNGVASLAVKGPVTFRLRVQSGEVEVVPSEKPQIALSVDGVPVTGDVQILQFGDRVEAEFNGRRQLRRGRLRVRAAQGIERRFRLHLRRHLGAERRRDVRVRTMSGDVKVQGARNATWTASRATRR